MQFAPRTARLIHSPIGAAHALVPRRRDDRDLLDLSQAAPAFPPAPEVVDHIASMADRPDTSRYAPQPGLPALREAFAAELCAAYRAPLRADNVVITAGCNQAFCLVANALAGPGDAMVLVSPFYFNHDMWLRHEGVDVRYLEAGPDGLPDPARLGTLADDRTRAVVLVSPGNPTGVTMPAALIEALATEADRLGLVTIVDETYRTHRPTQDPPHGLFAETGWGDRVVSLHSFSKDLAIPGYRVGAIVGGDALLVETLKILDCVAISAPRIGQEAALAGLAAGEWRRAQVERIAALEARFTEAMAPRPGGFELVTVGAYFGWVRHPLGGTPTAEVVRRLILDHDVLVIPGTAFTPSDQQLLRFSFANLEPGQIDLLPERLAELAR